MLSTQPFPTHTKIVLRDVAVTMRIGLVPWERERPQRLMVSLELYAAAHEYLRDVTPDSIIDYCPIYEHIQSWRTREHIDLVETLVGELLEICFAHPQVLACKVSVTKSEVLDQAQAAGVEACVHRADYERGRGYRRAAATLKLETCCAGG